MDDGKKREELLAKAREAEEIANRAQDPEERDSWHQIAQGYRELAKLVP